MADESTSITIRLNPKALLAILSFLLGGGVVSFTGFSWATSNVPSSAVVVSSADRLVRQIQALDSTVTRYQGTTTTQGASIEKNRVAIDSLRWQTARGFGALEYQIGKQGDEVLRRIEEIEKRIH